MEITLEVENLVKRFGKKFAVNSISFSVGENCVFGLLGPNGSGKTTTLRLLATTLEKTSGKIKIGKSLYNRKNENKIRHMIGYVPQRDALYPDLTVWENIDLFSSAYSYKTDRIKRIDEVLDQVNLNDFKNILCRDLSGGMAKRVSIACALVHSPSIILFDEITVGLDPQSRYQIWSLVRQLKKHATVIMTTHYMDEAAELCDEIVIMQSGKICAAGTPKELISKFKVENLDDVMLMASEIKNV